MNETVEFLNKICGNLADYGVFFNKISIGLPIEIFEKLRSDIVSINASTDISNFHYAGWAFTFYQA